MHEQTLDAHKKNMQPHIVFHKVQDDISYECSIFIKLHRKSYIYTYSSMYVCLYVRTVTHNKLRKLLYWLWMTGCNIHSYIYTYAWSHTGHSYRSD